MRNYTEEFVFSFPRGVGVFENGGIKIGMNFLHGPSWGADPGTSLIGFVSGPFNDQPEMSIEATEELVINGQPALLVTTETRYGTGQFYLFVVTDEIYLMLGRTPKRGARPMCWAFSIRSLSHLT